MREEEPIPHVTERMTAPALIQKYSEQCTVSELSHSYYHGTRRKSPGSFPGNVFSAIGLIKGNTGSVRGNVY